MGQVELAANLFRVTQTAERIRNTEVSGFPQLSQTAKAVGSEVRAIMLRSGGVAPENIPLEEDLSKVKKRLKSAAKHMKRLDSRSNQGRTKAPENPLNPSFRQQPIGQRVQNHLGIVGRQPQKQPGRDVALPN